MSNILHEKEHPIDSAPGSGASPCSALLDAIDTEAGESVKTEMMHREVYEALPEFTGF